MKRILIFPTLVLLLMSLAHRPSDDFSQLESIQGTWMMQTRKGPLFEQWRKTGKWELSSRSFRVNGTDTLLLERVRIVKEGENISYIAQVSGQNNGEAIPFQLIPRTDDRFIFENKKHDFPQRIIYRLVAADSIVVRIEGQSKGIVNGSDFFFKKVK